MIESVTLQFGRVPDGEPTCISTSPVTVFVGPNNSGKSQILRELFRRCSNGRKDSADVILDSLKYQPTPRSTVSTRIHSVALVRRPTESLNVGHVIVGKRGSRNQVPQDGLAHALENPNEHESRFCSWYLSYNTMMLDGKSRIELVNDQQAGDLQADPHSSLQVLFRDNQRRTEVRRIVKEALGLSLVIDPTHLGTLRIRLSKRPPTDEMEERGIHEGAIAFHKEAMPIDQASDGVKAFVGIVTEIIAGDPHVLLIDEPEAFLHPSLAFKLGKEISLATGKSAKRVFVSTHSPEFLMGCIQSGAPVNIVRLTYRDGVATARLLPSDEILKLMRNPLLRSTGVLGGLFYESVVVTESDTDRAFYQEINERLLRCSSDRGIPNCLFLNAQNKQTVRSIVRPLRQLGIACAGVVDVDIIKEGGHTWMEFLRAGFIPAIDCESLATKRGKLHEQVKATGKDIKRDGGIALLADGDQEAAQNLFDELGRYGLFVVRGGEIESWLSDLGVSGHGTNWLIEIFERMGEDPDADGFVRPAVDDVWGFVETIGRLLRHQGRKGIPA